MKKRRTLIISLLLIAALALGIGYAGFTSELVISGDAVLNSTTTSGVVITEVKKIDSKGEKVAFAVSGEGTKTVQVDLTGFATTQDYIVLEVTIANPHEFEVTLTPPEVVEKNNTIGSTSDKYFNFELVSTDALEDHIDKAEYVDGTLTPSTVTFQYKVSVANITADAHTVSYTITTNASSRATTPASGQ